MSPILQISPGGRPGPVAAQHTARCSLCSFEQLCVGPGLAQEDALRLAQLFVQRRRVARDAALYQENDHFLHLYAVRFGHFKNVQLSQRGGQLIGGFCMAGDLMGMEAIASGRHTCSAVALEDSEVCEIPFALLQELTLQIPSLLQCFHRVLSLEIEREQSALQLLSRMHADQRLAVFLVNLADRYAERGYSSTSFQLRMSREDIGAYLGLTVESVSRQLSRLRQGGIVALHNRDLRILDRLRLQGMAAGVLQRQPTAA